MKKIFGFFSVILLVCLTIGILSTLSCKENEDPCDAVWLDGNYMVYMPKCNGGSTIIRNAQYDYEFGWLLYYEFTISCGGDTYSGNVTITRDNWGNVLSVKKVVNGQICN